MYMGRKRLKEREKTDPGKPEKVNFHPTSGVINEHTYTNQKANRKAGCTA